MKVQDVVFLVHDAMYLYNGEVRKYTAWRNSLIHPLGTTEHFGDSVRLLQSRMKDLEPLPLTEEVLIRSGFSNRVNNLSRMGEADNPSRYFIGDSTNYYDIETNEFIYGGKVFSCLYYHELVFVARSFGHKENFMYK